MTQPTPEPFAAAASQHGKSIPSFLKSIDHPEHASKWRAGLDVTGEFSLHCRDMQMAELISLFGHGNGNSKLPEKDGKYLYAYLIQPKDMKHLVSHLSHFPFSPDPLEFWITIRTSGAEAKLAEAKIVDKTAYL